MIDRCSAEQQRRVRELFGLKPIEAHRDSADQVRRAFYVDGYGRDVVAVTFIRAKGSDPSVWVHFPRDADGKRAEPLRAPVPLDVWDGVLRRSGLFDRQLALPATAPTGSGEILLCLHSWVYTVEATDPSQGEYQAAKVRRKVEDACDDGPAEAYATELAIAAVPLLPPCARLEQARHRNEATLLSACRLLKGDRLAAAEAMNRLDALRSVEGPHDLALARGLFSDKAQIDWAGEVHDLRGGAAAFWAKKLAEAGPTVLFYEAFEGESVDRVRFVGQFSRAIKGESKYLQARVEQIWTREDGDLRIERVTVGAFEPESAAGVGN